MNNKMIELHLLKDNSLERAMSQQECETLLQKKLIRYIGYRVIRSRVENLYIRT